MKGTAEDVGWVEQFIVPGCCFLEKQELGTSNWDLEGNVFVSDLGGIVLGRALIHAGGG